MVRAYKAKFRGITPNRRRIVTGLVGFAGMVSVLTVLSLWVAPLPNPTPVVPPTVYVPANTVSSPIDASKPGTPTTVPRSPIDGDCGGYVALALDMGWPATEAHNLGFIMHAESACTTGAVGDNGNSRGLLQIHCPTWVAKTTYWPDGWAAVNGYPITCDDLHDPRTNLAVGFLIWAGVEGSSGGWRNWTTWRP